LSRWGSARCWRRGGARRKAALATRARARAGAAAAATAAGAAESVTVCVVPPTFSARF